MNISKNLLVSILKIYVDIGYYWIIFKHFNMGSSASIVTDPSYLFGSRCVFDEYSFIIQQIKLDYDDVKIFLVDEILQKHCHDAFELSIKEYNIPFYEQRVPIVLSMQFQKLTVDEKDQFNNSVMNSVISKFDNNGRSNKPQDYSKSFSGTAMDTKLENEAAKLLRGIQETNIDEANPYLSKPLITYPHQYRLLKSVGTWLKILSNNCYIYVNVLTKDIVSVQPEGYIEPIITSEKTQQAIVNDTSNENAVHINNLLPEIDRIINDEKKTPLIIDTSVEQITKSFFSYKGQLEDVSCLTIPFGKSGLKRTDVMERCRKRLVTSMKTGSTFILYLGMCDIEHIEWKKVCR